MDEVDVPNVPNITPRGQYLAPTTLENHNKIEEARHTFAIVFQYLRIGHANISQCHDAIVE